MMSPAVPGLLDEPLVTRDGDGKRLSLESGRWAVMVGSWNFRPRMEETVWIARGGDDYGSRMEAVLTEMV